MNLLLDTHALIWFLNGDSEINSVAKSAIENTSNEKYVSIATLLEIAIKVSINKLELKRSFEEINKQIDDNGFILLQISFEHATQLRHLPFQHRDPFDRILIAQAIIENFTILSKDPEFKKYAVNTLW